MRACVPRSCGGVDLIITHQTAKHFPVAISPRIVIVTGAHLARNPRAVKEASTLARHGYNVIVLAPTLDSDLVAIDQQIAEAGSFMLVSALNVSEGGIRSVGYRVNKRVSGEIQRCTPLEVAGALGYGMRRVLRITRQLRADYYIGHQEVGAWTVWRLMSKGYRVGADLEDWYSRDLLPEARAARPVKLLDRIEGDLVRGAAHCVTTSHAMADAMAYRYGRRPDVIYNAFPLTDRLDIDGLNIDRVKDDRPSLFWFSQTVGPGRNLEVLVQSLNKVRQPVQLHIRGDIRPEYEARLNSQLVKTSGHTLYFHSRVPPNELLSRIAEHDIGFALEPTDPPNKDLTISNKINQYLLGGLAVIATSTKGQEEVAKLSGNAVAVVCADPSEIANKINHLLSTPDLLKQAKMNALDAATSHFCWETQEPVLLRLVDEALS